MCIPADPNALATQACVLCSRVRLQPACHHIRAICTQRQNHPGHANISYFTNAEFDIFNGCGFCKFAAWAGKLPGKNRGYPGCCRPPLEADADLIPDSCWPAVAAFWKVPIPEKVLRRISPKSLAQLQLRKEDGSSPTTSKLSLKTALPAGERKPSPPTPVRGNSKITTSPTDTVRRTVETSRPGLPSFAAPPDKAPIRSSQIRPPGSNGAPPGRSKTYDGSASSVYVVIDQAPKPPFPSSSRPLPPLPQQDDELDRSFARLGIAKPAPYDAGKRSSIGSLSSLSDRGSDVTGSDFTDYLSDASDQRLQCEVEERVTQKFEEREFMQARNRVASVDLRPPDLWSGRQNGNARYGAPVQVASGRGSR